MVAGVAEAGLPPAQVGLHSGPVIVQEGDYYGQTVNIASRITDYAHPGDVLVSLEVVDATGGSGVAFQEIGPVELTPLVGIGALVHARRSAALPGLDATQAGAGASQAGLVAAGRISPSGRRAIGGKPGGRKRALIVCCNLASSMPPPHVSDRPWGNVP